MVSEERLRELIQIKNKQRAAMKAEYRKQLTNPHKYTGEGGTIFDAGIHRWMAMEATQQNYFKPTARNAVKGILIYVLPVAITMYFIKTQRDAKEKHYRSGLVSYRDREYKFI